MTASRSVWSVRGRAFSPQRCSHGQTPETRPKTRARDGAGGGDDDHVRRIGRGMTWTMAAPAISAAFLGSLVEAIEALTIVLAVATVRGWRPAGLGAAAGLASLALIVAVLGPLLDRVPLHLLQLVIGVLLLLFGMRWLRKAILRAAGVVPLHDEAAAFAAGTVELSEHRLRLDWLAGLASFKAVLLEGLEVVFIVIAVGAGRGLLPPVAGGEVGG